MASGITKHLAVEWAARGIRVNAVAPGTITTDAVAGLPEEYKAPMKRAHPIGRLGDPSEVANAGVIPLNNIVDATPEDWDHVMAVDGRGMFLTCKYAIEAMLEQEDPGGSIVCLSSISGLAGQAEQSTYGPAKFVASGITMHLAVEWAARGIRVNAVAPGTITTEAVAGLPEEYKAPMKQAHPIGRLGDPSEVANAILFLASDEASFVTGAILPVDGGYLAQ